MNNRLGICIPSYKHDKLKNCIDRILPVIYEYKLPIYISDNDSSEIFDYLQFNYPYIYYVQNPTNIGADRNMINVLKMCDTEYVFWLGDDDVFTNETLKIVFEYMDDDVDLLILGFTDNLEKATMDRKYKIIRYNSALEFYLKYEPNPIYFGNIVLKNSMNNHFKVEKYLGTLHAYFGYILEMLSQHDKNNIVIDDRKTMIRGEEDKSWKKSLIKVMLVDVMKFYRALPSPFHKYWFFMCIKRVCYYVKTILIKRLKREYE